MILFFFLAALQLVLTSMHKYVPRIHVIPASDYASLHWGLPVSVNTVAFPVCSFIAVTAYAVRSLFIAPFHQAHSLLNSYLSRISV